MKIINSEKLIEAIRNSDLPRKGELHRIIDQLSFEAPIGEIPQLKDKSQVDPTNVYYTEPTQIKYTLFIDGAQAIRSGIAFHEFVVDLSAGRPVRVQEILKAALDNGIDLDEAIIEQAWV